MKKLDLQQIQQAEIAMLKDISKTLDDNNIEWYLMCGSTLGAIRHNGPIPWDSDTDIGIPQQQLPLFRRVMSEQLRDCFYVDNIQNNKKYAYLFDRIAVKGADSDCVHIDVFPLVGMPDDESSSIEIMKRLDDIAERYYLKRNGTPYSRGLFRQTVRRVLRLPDVLSIKESAKELEDEYNELVNRYPYEQSNALIYACGNYSKFMKCISKEMLFPGRRVEYSGMSLPVPAQTEQYLRMLYDDYMQLPPQSERDEQAKIVIKVKDSFTY